MIKYVKGDLIKLADDGEFDVICHGCNCQGTMGAGIAKQIAKRWPLVAEVDKEFHSRNAHNTFAMLGEFSMVNVKTKNNRRLIVCNLYTQHYYGKGVQVDYISIKRVLIQIHETMPLNYRIGLPKIAAGLGGGDWNIIKSIIEEIFSNRNVSVVKYNK